jgi:hypothetical protein
VQIAQNFRIKFVQLFVKFSLTKIAGCGTMESSARPEQGRAVHKKRGKNLSFYLKIISFHSILIKSCNFLYIFGLFAL